MCVKAACVLIDGTTSNSRDCINEHLECCGTNIELAHYKKCTFHCCTGDLCNGVIATKPTAIGRAVLVPLMMITVLGFLF
ncbi:hypothetical protein niasHS_007858 [Heterodera schachtii]|uniref:Uncharacterized protein n=1 Tax=Heterodera schachtii TaxID=97005 RepID=A0ABD2JQA1_HETSC